MDQVNLKDITIVPILDSVKRMDMSDAEYFSKHYSTYVSNSRLKLINPEEGGSPETYKNPPHFTTTSLQIGSAVHCRLLQENDFKLAPAVHKPNAKLGDFVDAVIKYRKEGLSIEESMKQASIKANYYKKGLSDTRKKEAIKKGLHYYLASKTLEDNAIVLSDADRETVLHCLESINSNKEILDALHPVNYFGETVPSFNEDAMFIDFAVLYEGRSTILKYKMKIDNWTIDKESKILTLNDVKTTYKPVGWFMNSEYGSFKKYHYFRQFALYNDVLKLYCMKNFGYNENTWSSRANVLVVSTSEPYGTRCYSVSDWWLKQGKREYLKLLKMVGYYDMFGYDTDVNFF